MKKSLLILSIAALSFANVSAQEQESAMPVSNCYYDYYTAFRDRGAKAVSDGVNEVVVTIRKDGACVCLMGKVTVKEGKPINDLYLAREDGTFEKFKFTPHPKYARSEGQFVNYISNGMSPTYLSRNEEMINLFFIKALNDKQAHYKTAPPVK